MTERRDPARPVEIGRIGAPHGVKGALRVFLHNPQTPLLDTLPVEFTLAPPEGEGEGDLRSIRVRTSRPGPRFHVLEFEGVSSREAAAALTHRRLLVPRERLGESDPEEGWLGCDLEGLLVVDAEGRERGRVQAVAEFGAGPILVVRTPQGEVMVPFAEPWVGEVDAGAQRVVVDLDPWIAL